jgi:rhamnose transport system permease protein
VNSLRVGRQAASVITLLLFLIVLAVVAPAFFSFANLRDLALTNIPVLLVAAGMTLVIVLGQIDISVGSIFAVASVVAGLLAQAGVPIGLVIPCTVLAGALFGAVNGTLISYVNAPSIVVTLATMVVWRESLRWITGGAWVEGLPPTFQWFGLGQYAGQAVIVVGSLAVFAALAWASKHVVAFRSIYATGSDREAANLAGIPTRQVLFAVFVLMGALSGFGAMLNAVRFSDVPANAGIGLELKAIAAVVVGGTPITGGRGSLFGTFMGVCLLGCIGPALTFLGLSAYWEKAIQGAIILLTVLFDALAARASKQAAAHA